MMNPSDDANYSHVVMPEYVIISVPSHSAGLGIFLRHMRDPNLQGFVT
jgi:hypothetical protein